MLKHLSFGRFCKLGVLLMVVLGGVPALAQGGEGEGAAPAAKRAPLQLPDAEDHVRRWALEQLWAEKFDNLEIAANHWRQTKEAYIDGDWKLTAFYVGVGDVSRNEDEAKIWFEKLNKWIKAEPESITAQVALAVAWTEYAWNARGGGYAYSVTEEGWKLFEERQAKARLVLRDAKKLKQKCPHWWAAAQQVALGQGWPLDAYNSLFKEAVAFEPDYFPFYRRKSIFLLPRWHGDYGDSEQFALEAANARGGEAGDLLYARIIWSLYGWEKEVLANPEISFEKLDRGFAGLDKKYPNVLGVKVMWGRISYQTGTPKNETARKARIKQLATELEAIEPARTAPWRIIFLKMLEWANK